MFGEPYLVIRKQFLRIREIYFSKPIMVYVVYVFVSMTTFPRIY